MLHLVTTTKTKQVRQNGAAIREIRQREGLTISDLANKIGVSDPHLRNIECENKDARPEHIGRIAKALRCKPGAIVRSSELQIEDVA